MTSFDRELTVAVEDIEFWLTGVCDLPWSDFLLNPRRLRGSDFLMRWQQGEWSERRVIEAVNHTGQLFALPYGPSSVAPDNDVRSFELYFERLDAAGLGDIKRPDLLIFAKADEGIVMEAVRAAGGEAELPFTPEDASPMQVLLGRAILAVECENSLWVAGQMPDYGASLKPMARLGGRLGLRKGAVLPTVIVKEEDREPLKAWESGAGVPIHVWQIFYDMAFGISLAEVERLVQTGTIEATAQVFQAPGGPTTSKPIYKVYYHYAYRVGESVEEPNLIAQHIVDKNGHVLPYVRFDGGSFEVSAEALETILRVAKERRPR